MVDDVLHAAVGLEHLDHVGTPLAPAVGRVHGVDGNVATRVGGEPVVGKHRVRRVARPIVFKQVHPNARRFNAPGGLGHFAKGGSRDGFALALRRLALEGVVARGLRVGHEAVGSDHDHGGGGLDGADRGHGGAILQEGFGAGVASLFRRAVPI